jgi:hypothetical protein
MGISVRPRQNQTCWNNFSFRRCGNFHTNSIQFPIARCNIFGNALRKDGGKKSDTSE